MKQETIAANTNIGTPIVVTVDIFYIDAQSSAATGNTASGQYLFIFDQDVVHVTQPNTPISYTLTDDTIARGFAFKTAYVSDYKYQLSSPILSSSKGGNAELPDTISFLHSNTYAGLISVSLQAIDMNRPGNLAAYDPQITNEPGDH